MKHFDTICIGSGIGSMSLASILAQLYGEKVLVLEQAANIGGYTASFIRNNKYEWDVGLHYVGSLQPDSCNRKIMDLVTQKKVKWSKMPTNYDIICFPDSIFRIPAGRDKYMARLKKTFRRESKAIDEYFEDIDHVNNWYTDILSQKTCISPYYTKDYTPVFHRHIDFYLQTTQSYLEKRFEDKRLIAILGNRWGLHGMPPHQSMFCLHAITVIHYLDGGWYPDGGSSIIPKTVKKIITRCGGDVLTKHEVTELILQNGTVEGVKVETRTGQFKMFYANRVVSGIGIYNTYKKLIPPNYIPNSASGLINRLAPNVTSCLWLFIGLSTNPASIGIKGENYYLNTTYDGEEIFNSKSTILNGNVKYAFLSFPSLKNRRHSSQTRHTAEVLAFVDYDKFRKTREQLGPDALKGVITEGLLALVDYHIPHFSTFIEYTELSTPLISQQYTFHHKGAIYGLPLAKERLLDTEVFTPTTPIRNLYLVGADVLAPGIKSSMLSAVVTIAKMKSATDLAGRMQHYFLKE